MSSESMFKDDYVATVSKKFKDHNMTHQAAFGLAAGILTDIAYQRAAKKILGQAKYFELSSTAWIEIGVYTTKLMCMLLDLPKVRDFKDLKNIIHTAWSAWLLPLNIVEDTEDIFKHEIMQCPFPVYGMLRFDVKEDDHICRTWQAMGPA